LTENMKYVMRCASDAMLRERLWVVRDSINIIYRDEFLLRGIYAHNSTIEGMAT